MVIGAPKGRRRVAATSCVSRSIRASHRQSTEFLSRSAIPRKDQASEASQPTSSPKSGPPAGSRWLFRDSFCYCPQGGRESSDEANLVTPPSRPVWIADAHLPPKLRCCNCRRRHLRTGSCAGGGPARKAHRRRRSRSAGQWRFHQEFWIRHDRRPAGWRMLASGATLTRRLGGGRGGRGNPRAATRAPRDRPTAGSAGRSRAVSRHGHGCGVPPRGAEGHRDLWNGPAVEVLCRSPLQPARDPRRVCARRSRAWRPISPSATM